jgi:hypothetical protein
VSPQPSDYRLNLLSNVYPVVYTCTKAKLIENKSNEWGIKGTSKRNMTWDAPPKGQKNKGQTKELGNTCGSPKKENKTNVPWIALDRDLFETWVPYFSISYSVPVNKEKERRFKQYGMVGANTRTSHNDPLLCIVVNTCGVVCCVSLRAEESVRRPIATPSQNGMASTILEVSGVHTFL